MKWDCDSCTHKNDEALLSCLGCGSTRPDFTCPKCGNELSFNERKACRTACDACIRRFLTGPERFKVGERVRIKPGSPDLAPEWYGHEGEVFIVRDHENGSYGVCVLLDIKIPITTLHPEETLLRIPGGTRRGELREALEDLERSL